MSVRDDNSWSYKSEQVLRDLYHERGWDQAEIADEFGVTKGTISRWMSKFDIETSYRTIDKLGEEEVRRLYWEEGKTQEEIAEMVGSRQTNISRYMKKHDIEARDASDTPATFYTDGNGYEYWYTKPDSCRVPSHRLLAVLEYDLGELEGKDVHHKNRIPWDNRRENLELLSRSDHSKEHREREYGNELWRDREILRKKYIDEGQTAKEIADDLGCSMGTVYTHLHRFDIETRPSVAGDASDF